MSTKANSVKAKRNKGSVKIVGEGRDEIGNRYFRFAVRGSAIEIEPISVEQLTRDSKTAVYCVGQCWLERIYAAGANPVPAKTRWSQASQANVSRSHAARLEQSGVCFSETK